MSFAIGIALVLSAALSSPLTESSMAAQAMPQAQTIQEYVQRYFADEPILISIAECESHFRQFDHDGSIYRGAMNHSDIGVMQINEFYHKDAAKKLGLDLYTIQGNVAYARYLYTEEGTVPWASSSVCWKSKDQRLAVK